MYIIIIGGGKVGYYLGRALLDEGHEILVVEKDPNRNEFICGELGSVCIRGDGCEVATLTEVGTGRADMFIAVTGDDEDNLVACQVAKHKFNVPRTIARISNPQNETIFKKLGIDVTVSSTNIILENIEEEVPTHPLTHLLTIKDKGLEIVEVKIPPDSTTIGKPVKELSLPPETVLSLIIRKQRKPIVPTADTILQAEDQIIAATTPESEEALRTALRGS
ncbi:MAG: TrkA family potassium uptake protein [Dehalococcoidia bacterium]|nr:TrkA family potassium uptake protein [Dehalococcoidia bacterium]MBL7125052.1 TrkA family potassium uptake protein [Dehalococcoidales bacterium]